jgi:hypothetical protein
MLSTHSASRWKPHLPSLIVIALFFLAFFRKIIFSNKFLVTSDAFNYLYPLRSVAWNELRHGRLPLWTGQIMSGYPLLSMAQMGIGYPLTWSYLLLPGHWAEQIYYLAPYLLGPAFTYTYLRTIKLSQSGALLGAMGFAYGGFMISPLASYSGLAANAVMWLPLVLTGIERSRTSRFVSALLLTTVAYSMSVLSGWGQGFVYVGLISMCYAICVSLFVKDSNSRLLSWVRWQPLVAMLIALVMAAGVDAFQILETMQVQRLSIRRALTYELFTMGSYTFKGVFKSFLLPLNNVFEATAYVTPLVFVLAVTAVAFGFKRSKRDWRVFFWLATAVFGFVLMLGVNTPVAAVFFRIPPFNLFRGSARHAFELTFALSILSAYGWDHLRQWRASRPDSNRRQIYWTSLWLIVALVIGLIWITDVAKVPVDYMEVFYYPTKYPESRYLFWKLLTSSVVCLAAWHLLRVEASKFRFFLLSIAIGLACFFEPAIMVSRWWWPTLKPASRFTATSPVSRVLQAYPASENRIYTHIYPMVEEYADPPRLEPANLTMLQGFDNVAGNEPLIIDRYSRALGDVYIDAVKTRPGYPTDGTLFASSSHVLDLLNTRFVVSYPHQATEPLTLVERDGVKFDPRELAISLEPGKVVNIKGTAAPADTLVLVTATAWSAESVDGTEVARVRVISNQGKVTEHTLKLGVDTAEWAHDRQNVRELMRHSLATVFSKDAADQNDHEPAYKFVTRLSLGEPIKVDRIEISNLSDKIFLLMSNATLFNSATKFSMPLPHFDLEKWRPIYDQDGALILQNNNAMPRAWLVTNAEAVSTEEALRRIRGEGTPFDPRRTALLEISPEEMPALPNGSLAPNTEVSMSRTENNRISINTKSDKPAILVVSEINYPGWIATVDGSTAPIYQTDYLLRGVLVPAGVHRIEMRYAAPAARKGAVVSVITILAIAGLCIYALRAKQGAKPSRFVQV